MKETVFRRTERNYLNIPELYSHRQLLYYFVWRELKARYKQTALGVLWVVLQPLAMVTIFSVFISQLGRGSGTEVPYFIFVYTGLLFWNLFSSIAGRVSNSIVANASVIRKIYFPRLFPALTNVAVSFVDFLATLLVFIVILLVTQTGIQIEGIFFAFFALFLTIISSLGFGLMMSAINVKYRDVNHAMPFIIQAWFFLTPIIYPLSVVPESIKALTFLNPMTGVVSFMRHFLFDTGSNIDAWWLMISALSGVAMFAAGLTYFLRKEPSLPEKL